MATTFSISGTDLATASDLGVVTGYTQAAADLTNKITASLQQAGLNVQAASFSPSEFDLANWWEALSSSVGASNSPISFSGTIQVSQDDPGDGSLTSLVSAAVAGAVTTVTSVTVGAGVIDQITQAASSIAGDAAALAKAIADAAKNAGQGVNFLTQVAPYLILGTVVIVVLVLASGRKTNLLKLI